MPLQQIVIESHNLTLGKGTGIATYARNLAGAAKSLGYQTKALYSVEVGLSRKDPLFNEIRLNDARGRDRSVVEEVTSYVAEIFTDPFGITPIAVPRSGVVVDAAGSFAEFDETLAARNLFTRAGTHFARYGTFLKVRLGDAPTLLHTTHPTPIRAIGHPTVCTIHDIVPIRLPHTTLDDKKFFYDLIRLLVSKVDHIVTVSEHSKRDLMEVFKVPEDRITNTYQAVAIPAAQVQRPIEEVDEELRSVFRLGAGEYFLYFGAIEPKKNLSRLVDAFTASGTRRPLVIAGGLGWQYDQDLEKIRDERFLSYRLDGGAITPDRQIRHLNYVSRPRLISLIRGARAVLFPSIYEGFGLPVLESMLLGTPVMTSNVASLPEIAGDAAIQVDPYDIDKMAAAIRALDQDNDLRADLARRGLIQAQFFSPERYGERLRDLYARF